jgi:predicted secreted hydrolase
VSPLRRAWLLAGLLVPLRGHAQSTAPASVQRGRALSFPTDHGAHLSAQTEWWYATGWVGTPTAPTHGFQITFFRSTTGLAQAINSRFAARHVLFAHAALTSLSDPQHLHDQRMARWSGSATAAAAAAKLDQADVHIGRWRLRDDGQAWTVQAQAHGFALDLTLLRTQPLLLQGDAGFSRKGPQESQASHYVSEVQLRVQGNLQVAGQRVVVNGASSGLAWLDHEWSDRMLHPEAVGWDWIGMNLFDGSALTAFVLRRADGSTLWAGGSFRAAGAAVQSFSADAVRFMPGRRWRSASTAASYPMQWQVQTPAGMFAVRALLDAQELSGSQSTGGVYWEGVSELLNATGQRVGLGYLEMTGYAAPIKLS